MRFTEIFYSIQGEGLRVGRPSVFLRLFGCTLRCPSFGLPKGVKTTEVDQVIAAIDNYNDFTDLPLVRTGCDSYPSVYPQFKRFARDMSPADVVNEIIAVLPTVAEGKFGTDFDLVVTGGEPMLWQAELEDLLTILVEQHNLSHVTFETNGTVGLTADFDNVLSCLADDFDLDVLFSVSPKLSSSGEKRQKAIRPDVIRGYYKSYPVVLKFVVASDDDVVEVGEVYDMIWPNDKDIGPEVFLMPTGGCIEEYLVSAPIVANLCLKYGYTFTPREHLVLYKNTWAT